MRRLATFAHNLGIFAFFTAMLASCFVGIKGIADAASEKYQRKLSAAKGFAKEIAADSSLAQGGAGIDVWKVKGAFLGLLDYLEKPVAVEFNGKRYNVGMCSNDAPYDGKFTIVHGDIVFVEANGGQIRAKQRQFGASSILMNGKEFALMPENFSQEEIAAVKKLFAEVAGIASKSLGQTGSEIAQLKRERNGNEEEKKGLPAVRDSIAEIRNMVGKRQTGMEVTNVNGKEVSRTIYYDSIVSPKYDSLREFYRLKMDSVDERAKALEGKNCAIDREIKRKANSLKFLWGARMKGKPGVQRKMTPKARAL